MLDGGERHGSWWLRVEVDGDFPRAGLPDPVVFRWYVSLAGGAITQLIIILETA